MNLHVCFGSGGVVTDCVQDLLRSSREVGVNNFVPLYFRTRS